MKDKEKLDAKDASWQMFEKTGKINYYMLYKKLKDER